MSQPSEILTDSEIAGIEAEAQRVSDPARKQLLNEAAKIAKSQKSFVHPLMAVYKKFGPAGFVKGLVEYTRKQLSKVDNSNHHETTAEEQLEADRKAMEEFLALSGPARFEFLRKAGAPLRERLRKQLVR